MHADGKVTGMVLGDTGSRLTVRARGVRAPAVALANGRDVWFLMPDPQAASITQVVVGTFAFKARRRASAALEGTSAIDYLITGKDHRDPDLALVFSGLARPPHKTHGEQCDDLAREIAKGEALLRGSKVPPYANKDEAGSWKVQVRRLKQWLPEARAALADQCGPAGNTGGPEGSGTGSGDQGPGGHATNQPPTASFTAKPVDSAFDEPRR